MSAVIEVQHLHKSYRDTGGRCGQQSVARPCSVAEAFDRGLLTPGTPERP